MERVYEYTTWAGNEVWKERNMAAVDAGKAYKGTKFSVAIGEWGVRTFLVFAETKEEAKTLAITEYRKRYGDNSNLKICCRNVTKCKKYS